MSDKIESAREALDRITRWAVDNTEHFSVAMDAIGDETESIRAAFNEAEALQAERDQLREALEDTQRLLGRYLYLAGDIAINSASYRYEANRILLAQEDKDDDLR